MATDHTDATRALSRRGALRVGSLGLALATLRLADGTVPRIVRRAHAAPPDLPSIQHDLDAYIAPAVSIDGTEFRFGPVFTAFVTVRLRRVPTRRDQQVLAEALETIEAVYPFSPAGVFLCVAYGIPYFERLPGGMAGALVARSMPRLLLDRRRYALEEAAPAPTDVHSTNPDVRKRTFHLPVAIEQNDLLLTLRSDEAAQLTDVLDWLLGTGGDWLLGTGGDRLAGHPAPAPGLAELFEVTSTRLLFLGRGMPRQVAEANRLPWAGREHPDSPMWMGFASQQASSSGPAPITTFQGTAAARFTDAAAGDYFAEGSVQYLAHIILDLGQWYEEPYAERVQHMFRANPAPARGYADQFTDGGGPAFVANEFRNRDDARRAAIGSNTADGTRRIGHASALQRSSRAADGTPLHLRVDGPGFDSMDVPNGSEQPKLQFSIFVPSAEVFERMRRYQAGTDLVEAYGVDERHNGLERFFTTTRIQNFLAPPRRQRAFPLLELV